MYVIAFKSNIWLIDDICEINYPISKKLGTAQQVRLIEIDYLENSSVEDFSYVFVMALV